MPKLSKADQRRIIEANYGRDFGWNVLSSTDTPIATLTDCRWFDMFWDSYLVTPLGGHDETLTTQFWYPDCHFLQNIEFPSVTVEAFGRLDEETNRAVLRCAYYNAT